ncbi:putative mucin TcMUCII [Trypanosoma cruzi]|uniref:Mucin TcMUCII, putative n=2 Tax=Trypanosoma cruzi TaxID=5693 RepID=Q4CWS2_TRYCC|nr:mucin TcMUCII, putative [Trypanosoma cruzi]EAN84723.1 mucin TcMUCII, putative [Trypanosoma cruzi]PWU91029.1 putative mucin TcMUCII [Trypanosoma cruzi]RNC33923.1 mucin TcMUCII [Trypanosoma cruzi]|eukprot:XP_806574.1 mucin TcMUCII [Trypanosoma cruzi strain CL Brener]
MMMTCRLLCALLVLALCCCPSVCVRTDDAEGEDDSSDPSLPPKEQSRETEPLNSNTLPAPQPVIASATAQPVKAVTVEGSFVLSATQDETGAPDHSESADGDTNKVQTEGKESTTGTPSSTTISVDEIVKKAEDAAATTTNTTKAPITTTTTTTTTAAPEARSTTAMNTETPTTTTTRAPSGLREIDGSLGSSAWVCAPLLLAVSALAYTTVG